ncbi:MAG: 3-isopropylmalate dehydratase small subunit [SAR202 cluster bacterium]|nr:3-isopropylmalate dehydratase small subunit [Chloroflexota bacterium]MQG08338.1 3-isopropylmalate dehydratase small subunit [SAR202 cluster bacterium]MQG18058.1 3-isopropylmalate dehydratase small subunit [SAR202 cluster bacterium]MQG26643.1 3-isopropylmalate dehydratase small subunit [SAR202 cluster bacterium]MQG35555.1 3-isopropylmalate dehydratase small subunit [SAR202 cluster bacterium]
MKAFNQYSRTVIPMNRVNIDTDQIIPAVYLKRIERDGYGEFLFARWRYNEDGSENKEFILNQEGYREGGILVGGNNFGCGSSREHAPWALNDYGIRCVIAPSFADIFYNNCFQNGLLPLKLPEEVVQQIIDKAESNPNFNLHIDLESQRVWDDDEEISIGFDIDQFRKYCLMNGLDDIGLTLENEDKIKNFESAQEN